MCRQPFWTRLRQRVDGRLDHSGLIAATWGRTQWVAGTQSFFYNIPPIFLSSKLQITISLHV